MVARTRPAWRRRPISSTTAAPCRAKWFGYATGIAEDGTYENLVLGAGIAAVRIDASAVLVKPEIAQAQLKADAGGGDGGTDEGGVTKGTGGGTGTGEAGGDTGQVTPAAPPRASSAR